ncbi:MAG: MFS transporter [Candidatus Competibacteraceae bacterium]
MNFVIIRIDRTVGSPTVGGLIVHWLSWREIFFVNVPVGLMALLLVHRYMPDYRGDAPRPLDLIGLLLFGTGTRVAVLAVGNLWRAQHRPGFGGCAVLVVHRTAGRLWLACPPSTLSFAAPRVVSGTHLPCFGGRWLHHPAGHVGGLPFLLPLLYQLGLELPAWQSGLLMMPTAAAAMGMKLISAWVLRRYGYRQVLIVNTVMIGFTISLFAQVNENTPVR